MLSKKNAENLYTNPELLRLLQERDRASQELVWRSERGRLKAVAASILKSSGEAEMLVSDLFCDFFYNHIDDVRRGRAIPAYLRIMAVRRARRLMSRVRRQTPMESEFAGKDPVVEVCEQVDRSIWRRWLEECLAGLSSRARSVLRMHYGHDLSYANIAGQLGKSKQAVGKMVLKSLKALRHCLEKHRAATMRE